MHMQWHMQWHMAYAMAYALWNILPLEIRLAHPLDILEGHQDLVMLSGLGLPGN